MSKKLSPVETSPDAPGFEDALRRVEEAARAIEAGTLGLDEALARYEEGVGLLRRCRSLLDGTERRVALLAGVDEAGAPATSPFDSAATAAGPG